KSAHTLPLRQPTISLQIAAQNGGFIKSFWKSRNLFTKRFLAAGGKFMENNSLFFQANHL
ncbi:MAG: hypothetical protein KAW12_18915, partial [Candidatus Aminicenantes bacterium]|nr:hypothetical protein [Candidatus Aminicenantes bacterium]